MCVCVCVCVYVCVCVCVVVYLNLCCQILIHIMHSCTFKQFVSTLGQYNYQVRCSKYPLSLIFQVRVCMDIITKGKVFYRGLTRGSSFSVLASSLVSVSLMCYLSSMSKTLAILPKVVVTGYS